MATLYEGSSGPGVIGGVGTGPGSKGPNFLQQIGSRIGDFLSSDAAPVVLGQAAQAVMGGTPEGRQSWQSGLGAVGAGLGQSRIAAKAAQRQAQERAKLSNMLAAALGGNVPYTDEPDDGPTTSNFKMAPDGSQTFTMKGRGLLGGPTNPSNFPQQEGAGSQSAGSSPKPEGNVRPSAPPQIPATQSSLLPFYLAQAVTGSGGSGGNLFGLSPEQIGDIGGRDIAGQEMLNRGVGNLFNNMVRQSQAEYYNRLPQQAGRAPGMSFTDMKIDDKTGNWAYFDRVQNRVVDTGIKAQPQEDGSRPPQPMRHPYTDQRGRRRSGLFLDGRLVKDLGGDPETTPEAGRSFGIDKDLGDIEARILKQNANPQDMANFNSRSKANYYYIPKEEGLWGYGKDYERIDLPPGATAADMYTTLQKHPNMTIEQVLQIIGSR